MLFFGRGSGLNRLKNIAFLRMMKKRQKLLLIPVALLIFGLVTLFALFLYAGRYAYFNNPSGTLLIEDDKGRFLAETGDAELGFWPVQGDLCESSLWCSAGEGNPGRLRAVTCLISVEDRRFFHHTGVDTRSLARAFLNNFKGGKRQGASTIAMQVARMQMKAESRGYFRKLIEMMVAIRLVHRYGREAVLKQYLKIVPMGNRIHSVSYAARRYFRKPLEDLSWAEGALLASLPKAPGRMNLFRRQGRADAVQRARKVLDSLMDHGILNSNQKATALRLLSHLNIQGKELRPEITTHAILRLDEEKDELDLTHPVRIRLDLDTQSQVDRMCHDHLAKYRPFGAGNLAVIVAEKDTGYIKSYIGSAGYGLKSYAGSMNYAHTPRSSGSTLKPFIYGYGLEDHVFTPSSILSDLPWSMTHQSGHYSVYNYDFTYLGPLIYRKALANSRNIPAVQVLRALGVHHVYSRLRAMNLAREENRGNYYGLGLAIGGLYVTLEDLVCAYGSLANEGAPYSLKWNEEVKLTAETGRTLSPEVSRTITLFLSDPLARLPSFPRMDALEYPFPVAVKTGTSQGFRDAWCVAYSQKYIVGVWMGHPDNQSMKKIGGSISASLAKRIMLLLHPQETRGTHVQPFPPPRGYVPHELCSLSGDLASPRCTSVVVEYFPPGQGPKRQTSIHRARSAGSGSPSTAPGSSGTHGTGTVTVLDATYADWGYQHGFPGDISGSSDQNNPDTVNHILQGASARITSPVHGAHLFLDPDVPERFQTISLRVEIEPSVSSVIWNVDGQTFAEVSYPYSTRWPMKPGRHVFQVFFPHAHIKSRIVAINVD